MGRRKVTHYYIRIWQW